jgi:hypothetical protein
VKLGKSTTENLEMLREAEYIHVSRPVECPLKMTNVQGDQAPEK